LEKTKKIDEFNAEFKRNHKKSSRVEESQKDEQMNIIEG